VQAVAITLPAGELALAEQPTQAASMVAPAWQSWRYWPSGHAAVEHA